MMHTLQQLQQMFLASMLTNTNDQLNALITTNETITGANRLQIYRNNVFNNYIEGLATIYPVVAKLIGEACFNSLAKQYIRENLKGENVLLQFGNNFSEFLAQNSVVRNLPYLSEVAALEWARQLAFHAAESPAFDFRQLQKVEAENYANIKFKLAPACQLLRHHFPTLDIWQYCHGYHEDANELNLSTLPSHQQLMITRRKDSVVMQKITVLEFLLLTRVSQDISFGELYELALSEQTYFDMTGWIQQQVSSSVIVGFYL